MLSAFLCVALLGASAIANPITIDKYENCTFTKNGPINLRTIFGQLDANGDDDLTYEEYCVLILSADDGEHTLPGGQTQIMKEGFEGAWTIMMEAADIKNATDKACAYMKKADECLNNTESDYYKDNWLIVDTTPKGLNDTFGQNDEGRCVFNYMGGYALGEGGKLPENKIPPKVVNIADFCTNMRAVIMKTKTEGACTEERNDVANSS